MTSFYPWTSVTIVFVHFAADIVYVGTNQMLSKGLVQRTWTLSNGQWWIRHARVTDLEKPFQQIWAVQWICKNRLRLTNSEEPPKLTWAVLDPSVNRLALPWWQICAEKHYQFRKPVQLTWAVLDPPGQAGVTTQVLNPIPHRRGGAPGAPPWGSLSVALTVWGRAMQLLYFS